MGVLSQASERLRGSNNYKDYGIRRLFLGAVGALEKDNESRRVINHQFKVQCETRGLPCHQIKRLSSAAGGQKKTKVWPRN